MPKTPYTPSVYLLALLVLALSACGRARHEPLVVGTIESEPGVAVPLDVDDIDIVDAADRRALLFKLTRLPQRVEHDSDGDRPRIVLTVFGPTGGAESPRTYPVGDDLVPRIHVSREAAALRIIIDIDAPETPPYTVHPMADWIMVRISAAP